MKSKRQQALEFMIANNGATIDQICQYIGVTKPSAR